VVAELIQLASARGALTRNVIFVHGLDADPRGIQKPILDFSWRKKRLSFAALVGALQLCE
jgi:hypothetical protein